MIKFISIFSINIICHVVIVVVSRTTEVAVIMIQENLLDERARWEIWEEDIEF